MRQDDFREHIAQLVLGLEASDRRDRVRLYRFARALLRTGLAEPASPRGQTFLDLEGAIRDFERAYRHEQTAQLELALTAPTPSHGEVWAGPGIGAVLAAMIRRDIRGMLARDPFAYLWLFLAPALTIAVHFWAYTFVLGLGSVLDMPVLPFLILGIGGWHMMRALTLKLGHELARERNLARVYRIDTLTIAFAKAIELAFAYTAIVAIGLVWFTYANGYEAPRNLLGVAFYWSLLAIAGLGAGLLLSLAREFLPGLSHLAMPIFRVGFFFSGVVVVSEQFPERFRVFLTWNPVLHIMQLLRTEYFVEYRSIDAMPLVAGFFALAILFLGCVFVASRRRREAMA